MERKPVTSSHVVSVGYDPESHTLEVEYKDGAVYQYGGVPASVYDALIHADSVGRYLRTLVQDGYTAHRV
jgi:hypothetical protein